MSDRITSLVLLDVVPGKRSEVESRLADFVHDFAAGDPGTETYIVLRPNDQANRLVIFEEFRDAEAVVAHTADSKQLTADLAPLLAKVAIISGQVIVSKLDHAPQSSPGKG